MAEGHSLSSALVQLASAQTGAEVEDGNKKRSTMRNADRLAGVGNGGEAPTTAPTRKTGGASDLKDGTARRNAQRRLAGG
jgi:hypothetical protein